VWGIYNFVANSIADALPKIMNLSILYDLKVNYAKYTPTVIDWRWNCYAITRNSWPT
jgi:hypothetical protein